MSYRDWLWAWSYIRAIWLLRICSTRYGIAPRPSQSLYDKPAYDAAADFVPVVLLVDQSMLLAVRKDLPAGTLQEFIAYARVNQEKMQYGSAGIGSPTHLACALLNAAIGAEKATHVPSAAAARRCRT